MTKKKDRSIGEKIGDVMDTIMHPTKPAEETGSDVTQSEMLGDVETSEIDKKDHDSEPTEQVASGMNDHKKFDKFKK